MLNRAFIKSRLRFFLCGFFLLAGLIAATACLPIQPVAAQETRKSCLWLIKTEANKIYLLGSLHVLKKDAYPLSADIQKAYADSQVVIFETDIEAMQAPAMQTKMLELGVYPDGQNLLQNLDENTRQMLVKKMSELGLPLESFSKFKPWLMALTLTTLELQRLGFNPSYGVDVYFFNKAQNGGKEIDFLEPAAYQINLLGNMAQKDQNAFLSQTLKDLELVNELATDLVRFWKSGDAAKLHELLHQSFKDYPDLQDRLLIQRNKKWVAVVEDAMRRNKNALFVVGAGHLVGPASLVDLLRQKGYEVKQQ